jgi:osmotically-inducible protein OsmY
VKAASIRHPLIDAAAIGVTADDGRVRLDGFVETEYERRQAERSAGGVKRVTGTINEIEMK